MNDSLGFGRSDRPLCCTLCHALLSSDVNDDADPEASGICGDCKFLFLEDHGTPVQEDRFRTRARGSRRRRYRSSEPTEGGILSLASVNQATVSENDTVLIQLTSSRTTPSGSRRWRRVLSDAETDGFDSLFGESESNVSFSGSRFFRAESDTVSFSAYGGESDASVDEHAFLERDTYHVPDVSDLASDQDTDTDIDPMHAGLYYWNSDDTEEEHGDEYVNSGEEAVAEEIMFASVGSGAESPLRSVNLLESSVAAGGSDQAFLPQLEGTIRFRIQEGRSTNIFNDLEEPVGENPAGDEVAVVQDVTESEGSRGVAPPAAVSIVRNLPVLVIGEGGLEKVDAFLGCAICKEDSLHVGTVVNQLPCSHIYHPSCILPWLNTRNSCPLCRYELPTDDKDYEDRKQTGSAGLNAEELQRIEVVDEDSSWEEIDGGGEAENDHNRQDFNNVNMVTGSPGGGGEGRRGWVFVAGAAAPIVGIILVFCFSSSINTMTRDRIRWASSGGGPNNLGDELGRHAATHLNCHTPGDTASSNRSRRRRWWCLF